MDRRRIATMAAIMGALLLGAGGLAYGTSAASAA